MYELPELPGFNYVDLNEVIKSKKYSKYVKRLAKTIQNDGFCTVADFLRGLTLAELDDFMLILSDASDDRVDQCVLVTTLLSIGEGLDINFEDDVDLDIFNLTISNRLEFLIKYTLFESLGRKGYLRMFYENWTLDVDVINDSIVVESLNDNITEMIKGIWKTNGK